MQGDDVGEHEQDSRSSLVLLDMHCFVPPGYNGDPSPTLSRMPTTARTDPVRLCST